MNVWSLIAWALVNSDESRFLPSCLYYLSNVLKAWLGTVPDFSGGGHKSDFPEGRYPPIMSIMCLECIKPDLKFLTEHTSF